MAAVCKLSLGRFVVPANVLKSNPGINERPFRGVSSVVLVCVPFMISGYLRRQSKDSVEIEERGLLRIVGNRFINADEKL